MPRSTPPARRSATRSATVGGLALLLVAGGAGSVLAQDDGPPQTTVPGGPTAAADAAGWSQLTFADGAAPTVLIATDADFADALSAGAVQGLLDAPLLLTNPTVLSPETAAEIARLGADTAIIFGGEEAVGPAVETTLEGSGLTTERVMGETRIQTAIAVQQRFFPDATAAVLARAFGTDADPSAAFADSVPGGAYATVTNTPVLLTETDSLSAETGAALAASDVDSVTILGGTSAVADAVASTVAGIQTAGSLAADSGIAVDRLSGLNRYDTAATISRDLGYQTAADASRVILVDGQGEDAWVGGLPAAAQAGNGAAFVLATGDFILSPTFEFLFEGDVPLICGPNVSEVACDKALAALQGQGQADMPQPGDAPDEQPDGEPSEEPTEEPTEEGPTGVPIIDDIIDPGN